MLDLPTFQMKIFISPPATKKKSTWFQPVVHQPRCLPALSKTFNALGCQSTWPTRRWCATRSTAGWVKLFEAIPPSGICQTLTVQSSEPLAMTLSLCGHQAISKTAALCPVTKGTSRSIRPTLSRGRTRNAPPPADSVMIARNFGFTVQNVESQALLVMRIFS